MRSVGIGSGKLIQLYVEQNIQIYYGIRALKLFKKKIKLTDECQAHARGIGSFARQ